MPGLAEIVRLRTADCRQAAAYLPSIAAGEEGADARARDHIAECLRCQAEVAAYRRLLRHLRALRHDEVPSPPGALAAVLAALEAAELGEIPSAQPGPPPGLRRRPHRRHRGRRCGRGPGVDEPAAPGPGRHRLSLALGRPMAPGPLASPAAGGAPRASRRSSLSSRRRSGANLVSGHTPRHRHPGLVGDGLTLASERQQANPPVGGIGAALHQASDLQPIDQAGQVGCLAVHLLGQTAHGDGSVMVKPAQHVELSDREALLVTDFANVVLGAVDQPDGEGGQIEVDRGDVSLNREASASSGETSASSGETSASSIPTTAASDAVRPALPRV